MAAGQSAVTDPDAPLVTRARQGDRAAFDQLVERHLGVVWRVVHRIVRHDEDARDVTQDVFIAAWQALAEFRGDAKFSTWLHQVAVSRALNHVQRAGERVRRASLSLASAPADADVDGGPAWDPPSHEPSPLAALEAHELLERLAHCLQELPAEWRAALALREGEGFSYEAIAGVAKIALGTVRSRLARARAQLLTCIEEAGR